MLRRRHLARAATASPTAPIALGGSEETKKKYLGMLTEEPKLASFCLTEPDAGLRRLGHEDDRRAARATSTSSTAASASSPTAATPTSTRSIAKTDKDAGHNGISAFVVDRDLDGVTVDKKEDKLGQRASNTATISFNDVEIPVANLLGRGEPRASSSR